MALELEIRRSSPVSMEIETARSFEMTSEGISVTLQQKEISPSDEIQEVEPDSGFYLSKVTVRAIPEPERYEGSYTVIPDVDSQTLLTKDKVMADDLTVTGIPYWETSNVYGTTIYIADELGE